MSASSQPRLALSCDYAKLQAQRIAWMA